MSSEIALSVEGLSKCYHIYDNPRDRLLQMLAYGKKQFYREFWALRDISFTVTKGETIGIIGRNGSGKSTLLQIVCGTVSPTYGVVNTNGRIAAILELGAGFNTEFTGRENVLLNAAILGFSKETMEARMAEVLAFSELGDFLDQPVKTYSSGMYARLAISIAIHLDPEILVVDEALAVGDARFVAKCMRRIKDVMTQGTTVLFVSHDVSSIRTLCQRVIWLDQGRMVEEGEVFPVTGRYMAFMFKDEQSAEETLQNEIATQQSTGSTNIGNVAQDLQPAGKYSAKDSTVIFNASEPMPEIALDSRPVTHWGSRKGIILSASVRDKYGIRKNVYAWGEEIEILIDLSVPAEISREYLSVAFSIKDLKGTDLIVSTTHDFEHKQLPGKDRFSVSFKLINPLITGKYLLVAAVENRQYNDIHYYEYFEGAHYFSSLAKEHFFGLFQPPIEQLIMVK